MDVFLPLSSLTVPGLSYQLFFWFTSCSIEQGISDYCGVLLEVEWEEYYCRSQVDTLGPVYNKANVLGLHTFLLDKFAICESRRRCVEEVWSNFKAKYYNRKVKRLKLKVRKACNRRKSRQQYREELKRLSKQLLLAKKNTQKSFLRSVLKMKDGGRSSTNM
jgi:hypothetical protein